MADQTHIISAMVVLVNAHVVRHQGVPEKPCVSTAVMTLGTPTVMGPVGAQHLAML